MAEGKTPTAPAAARDREVMVTGRDIATVPEPKHGDPAEALSPTESVIGAKVGSEAAVEDGDTSPVLPYQASGLSELTRVKNTTLRARDEREFRKRGLAKDGTRRPGTPISVTFEGPMVVEREAVDGEEAGARTIVSGSYTGEIPQSGLTIRPLTEEEMNEHFPTPQPDAGQRSNDLVMGSGTGGGGNPMHAGRTRGTSSVTAPRVGQGGVTSQSGKAPPPSAFGAPGTADPGNRGKG